MTGNIGLDVLLIGLFEWLSIFGSMVGLVLLVTLTVSLVTQGPSGPRSIFGNVFHSPVTRLGGKVGAVLGVILGGAVGWYYGPQAVIDLKDNFGLELDQFGDITGAIIGLVVCSLIGLVLGPVMCASVFDVFQTSPRRLWALTVLTVKESWARKLIWIFAVFVILFMFFSWFLPRDNLLAELQVKNSISTALFPITWLPLMVVMLLSCWGLPEDIKNRTVHTVVTKPVRRSEIFLGRLMGFICVGTFLLVVMGGVGYVWILRQIPEEAKGRLICRVPIQGDLQFTDRDGNPSTGINVGDEDVSRMYVEGGTKSRATWTFHNITSDRLGDTLTFESRFRAFRMYKGDMDRSLLGQMRFVNKMRERSARALGFTEELNEIHQHIEAGAFTDAADALSTIADGLQKNQLELSQITLESMSIGYEVFTDILEPIHQKNPDFEWIGELISAAQTVTEAAAEENTQKLAAALMQFSNSIRENATQLEQTIVDIVSDPEIFEVQEFGENVIELYRDVSVQVGNQPLREGDLYTDLVHGGELQVEVMCLDHGQFLGMANPDLFVRAQDNDFAVGYSKTLFGIWLMISLVAIIGVTSSCFVKGPVGILLTLTLLVVGSFFHGFLEKIVQGDLEGGGAIETAHRILTHINPRILLEESNATLAMRSADKTLTGSLWLVHKIVPNFSIFRMSEWIVEGFDVPWIGEKSALLPGMLMTLAYLLPCLLIGSYSLKLRELESK